MNKPTLALFVGATVAASLAASSNPLAKPPESISLVLEIEHIQKEKLSTDERVKLDALVQTVENATSGEERMRADRRLASFQSRIDRTKGLLLFGRATYWLPPGRLSKTPIGNFVPQFGDHATGAFRRDDPIIVGVDSKLTRGLISIGVGDFVTFSARSSTGRAETVRIDLPLRHALRARVPTHKIEKPTWWPEAPIKWSPIWEEPDRQVTAASGLELVSDRKEYRPGYYLVFQIHNGSDLDIRKASVWFRLLDGDGDIIGRGRPSPRYFRITADESIEIATRVSAAVYEAYASAELSVDFVERPTDP